MPAVFLFEDYERHFYITKCPFRAQLVVRKTNNAPRELSILIGMELTDLNHCYRYDNALRQGILDPHLLPIKVIKNRSDLPGKNLTFPNSIFKVPQKSR